MNFNEMYQSAMEVVNYAVSNRGYIEPGTTVCVLAGASGRMYNGVSRPNVHAEIEAVRNMQSFGETAVTTIILVDANTRLAMLPCMNCINYILTLSPANYNAVVVMPDRPVSIPEIQQNHQASMQFNSINSRVSAPVSSMVISGRAKGGLLKDKVGSLMGAAADTEDEDDDLIEELRGAAKEKAEGKKGLFGLFGGKK
jgi:cytidine deaminase